MYLYNRALIISAVCSVLATIVSLYSVYGHLKHWARPELQRSIVRILLIVPVYAISSLASFSYPTNVSIEYHVFIYVPSVVDTRECKNICIYIYIHVYMFIFILVHIYI